MGLLKRLNGLFTRTVQADRNYYVYVQCKRCGEKIRVRVDMSSELSPEYGSGDFPNGYYCRKVVVGEKRCFQPIEINLKFDGKRRLLEKEIAGGQFLTEEEYAAGDSP